VARVTTTTGTYRPTPLQFARLSDEEAVERSREFLARLSERRSVRQFSSEPVSHELIENAIRAAGAAPSGANQQPWTFVVVSDPQLKARIRAAAEHEPIGTDEHKPHVTDAPYLIAVFEQSWSRGANGEKRKNYYVRESVGIAVGFLLLALHNAGLATLTHAPSPMGFLRDILERPENERPFLLIPVGYPAEDAEVPVLEKKSLAEIADFR